MYVAHTILRFLPSVGEMEANVHFYFHTFAVNGGLESKLSSLFSDPYHQCKIWKQPFIIIRRPFPSMRALEAIVHKYSQTFATNGSFESKTFIIILRPLPTTAALEAQVHYYSQTFTTNGIFESKSSLPFSDPYYQWEPWKQKYVIILRP